MTAQEWNDGIEFLETAKKWSWVEFEGRKVEIVNMCGGKYALQRGQGFPPGLHIDPSPSLLYVQPADVRLGLFLQRRRPVGQERTRR